MYRNEIGSAPVIDSQMYTDMLDDEETSALELLKQHSMRITIPRIRSVSHMKCDEFFPEHFIQNEIQDHGVDVVIKLCDSIPFWNWNTPCFSVFDTTDKYQKYLNHRLDKDGNSVLYTSIKWKNIHGWKRKRLKFILKQEAKKIRQYWETINKYAGRDDVYAIFARIGGSNWLSYGGREIEKEPGFLEKVDLPYDETYAVIFVQALAQK